MTEHDAFLDRMTARLNDLETQIQALAGRVAEQGRADREPQLRELEASLMVARERLQVLRRAGADLTTDMTQSFAQSYERLSAAVGRFCRELEQARAA